MARKEATQVFPAVAVVQVKTEQPFDGVGNLRGGTAIAYRTRKAGVFPHGSAQAKVVCVLQDAIHFDPLSFQAYVSQPMLAATVGAPGHVEPQLLVERGYAFVQLF